MPDTPESHMLYSSGSDQVMYFDALTTAAVRDELAEKALGGRFQRVLIPSEDSLALEIYAHGQATWLFASYHPQHASVHLSQRRLRRLVETESPLLLLLRKYVRDGRLTSVEQLPLERVLVLTVTKRLAVPEGKERAAVCKLIIEIMGRYSNIILTDEQGSILDSAKRIHPGMNRYRVVLPHHQYVPPPPQNKLPPDRCSPAILCQALRSAPTSKSGWQVLVETFRAISPLLAREIIYRATRQADATAKTLLAAEGTADRIDHALHELFSGVERHGWKPCVALEGEAVVAFAPYLLTHLPSVREVSGISQAITSFQEHADASRPHQLARNNLLESIKEERERLLRKRDSLQKGMDRVAEAGKLRTGGELILSYASQIAPGQAALEVDGLTIELDPRLSPVENAQAYFREYAKAKAARDEVPALLEEVRTALAYLDEMSGLVEIAEDAQTIARLRDELNETAFVRSGHGDSTSGAKRSLPSGKKTRKAKATPLKVAVNGFDVWIGRSGRENEEVTFEIGSPNDLWLHARGVPGAHVVIDTSHGDPDEATMEQVAALAASYSQARYSTKVPVDCTRRKHVRKVRGAPPGLVTYTNETTLTVRPGLDQ